MKNNPKLISSYKFFITIFFDGTPYTQKCVCTVWTGGKDGIY